MGGWICPTRLVQPAFRSVLKVGFIQRDVELEDGGNVFFTLTVPMTVATATPPRPTNADPEDIESILYFFGIIDNQK